MASTIVVAPASVSLAIPTKLSLNDYGVLAKIQDPEADPFASAGLVDPTLPRDPHLTDPSVYEAVAAAERDIVLDLQRAEVAAGGLAGDGATSAAATAPLVEAYQECLARFDGLVEAHRNYASARNNRAQVLRRLYGDGVLLATPPPPSSSPPSTAAALAAPLLPQPNQPERAIAAATLLGDLDAAIALLTPKPAKQSPAPFHPSLQPAAVSPQSAKTLARAYTQRAAVYLATARGLEVQAAGSPDSESSSSSPQPPRPLLLPPLPATATRHGLEAEAAHDFAGAARYGSELGRALAVATNPTARLCGAMVREAMRREYGEFGEQ